MILRKRLLIYMVFLVLVVSTAVALTAPYPALFDIKTHRFLHILGGILFLGNILTGALWMIAADKSQSPRIFRFAIRAINLADLIFTGPGALLLVLNGAVLSALWPSIWATSWLKISFILFVIAGAVWAIVLVPMQISFERQSDNIESFTQNMVSPEFRRKLNIYFVFGSATGVIVLFILFLMIWKPV